MQVFYVNIGGGEPTVRPDFWELVDYATAHQVGVKFSTNGIRIDAAVARRLAATDYVDVQISLDGATAEVNDAVRGDGSYATAIARHGAPAPRPASAASRSRVVVTRHNVDQLDEFKAHRRRVRRAAAADPAAPVRPRCGRLARAAPDRGAAARALRLAGSRTASSVLTGDSFFHLAAFGEPLPGLNLCGAGRVVCLIDPVGDVYACPFAIHDEFLAGNVREPGGFAGGVARLRAVRPAARAAERRRLRVVRLLRRLPGRLHGGQVLHRAAARRPGSRVRPGPRRDRAAPGRGPGRRRSRRWTTRAGQSRPAGPVMLTSTASRPSRGRDCDENPLAGVPDLADRATHGKACPMSNPWFETVAEAQRRAKKRLPTSVYGALLAGSEKGVTVADNARRLRRTRFRPARGRAVGQARPGHHGHGPADLAAGDHLADRGAGRAPRRRGRRGPRGRRPRHGDGAELVRQQAGRGGRRGQPADVLPDCTGSARRDEMAQRMERARGGRRGRA